MFFCLTLLRLTKFSKKLIALGNILAISVFVNGFLFKLI
jgi:hypothetical protein